MKFGTMTPALKNCILKSLSGYKKIYLPDSEEVHIGRRILTGVKDKNISRTQLSCIADYKSNLVTVVMLGRNYSTWNGYLMPRNVECKCKEGDLIELICGNYKYELSFTDDSQNDRMVDDDEQPLESVSSVEQAMNVDSDDEPRLSTNNHSPNGNQQITDIEGSWEEIGDRELLVFSPNNIQPQTKIAAFDMDGTIIVTKSGARFPVAFDDWRLAFSAIKQKLLDTYKDNYKLVFFTNQAGISRNKITVPDFKKKIDAILKDLNLPIQVFVATGPTFYRKPCPGMWNAFVDHKNNGVSVDMSNSFYVGDAAGRPKEVAPNRKKDHSFADRLFALNIGLKFYTPEEFFLGRKSVRFLMPEFDPRNLPTFDPVELSDSQEVIIMVGGPGSGKSFYCQNHIGYEYINRDKMGTWQKCVQKMEEALTRKLSVVIDNTNGNKNARKRYVDVAKKYNIPCRCFMMTTTVKHCFHNNKFRSITDKSHIVVGDMVIYSYFKYFEEPTLIEGFSQIAKINFSPKFDDAVKENLYKSFLLEH